MKYLLFLFGFFSFNVMALCSESPSLNDACRYPAGDSWCATKAEGKPYAYEDKWALLKNEWVMLK